MGARSTGPGAARLILLFVCLTLAGLPGCAGNRPPSFCESYREADDPAGKPGPEWAAVDDGIHVSVGSIDEHYLRGTVPAPTERRVWSGTAWRGEKVSAQLVTWASEPLHRLEVWFSDFVGEAGRVLPGDIARARFARYVLTDEFAEGCGRRQPEDHAAHLYPDGLEEAPCFNVPAKSTRPVWLTFDVPRDAVPGMYTSNLEVRSQGREPVRIQLELEVLPRTLPPPSEWEFHLDLWQNPYAVARVEGVEPWSEAHWHALRPLMAMLADAGQKVITTTITDAPWAGQTFDPFESMVVWKYAVDGGWEFDYTVFDRWVEFMMDLGVNKQINAFSLLPWSDQLAYIDEATGERIVEEVEPGSDRYVELWTPFLIDFRAHLEDKGWNTITNIAMDESGPEDVYSLTTTDERFHVTFNQYGHYMITMTGSVNDVWGNTYRGGGTYDVWMAHPLDVDPGVLPGTPFEVGDSFNPSLQFYPRVPAHVHLTVTLYPNSDSAQAVTSTVVGDANEFGYFSPSGQAIDIALLVRDDDQLPSARDGAAITAGVIPDIQAPGALGIQAIEY